MNPQFIICIVDTKEIKYDSTTGDIIQPFSMINYEFTPQEDGRVGHKIGVLDNSITGKLQPQEDGGYPETPEDYGLDATNFVESIGDLIANNNPETTPYISLMGYSPDKEDAKNLGIYTMSVQIADQVVEDYYDMLKASENKDIINYDRIVSWMDKVKEYGAENVDGTITAVLSNPGDNPQISGIG